MAKKANSTKPTETNQAPVAPVVESKPQVDPVVERLDRVIDLLEQILPHVQRIPFQGIDLSKLCKD